MDPNQVTRAYWEQQIRDIYSTEGEYPWISLPTFEVFRHSVSRKWFALIGIIPEKSLGLQGQGTIQFMNLKADPMLIGPLHRKSGFFPAYHMSKTHWITLALDGTVPDEEIRFLLDRSYELTGSRK